LLNIPALQASWGRSFQGAVAVVVPAGSIMHAVNSKRLINKLKNIMRQFAL
jgi:hypothetical protein